MNHETDSSGTSEGEEQVPCHAETLAAMGRLTGGFAHEINNLLAPMMAAFELLSRPGLSTERTGMLTERGLEAVNLAKSLVQQLLAYAGRQPMQISACDIGQLMTGLVKRIRCSAGLLVEIILNIDQDLSYAHVDPRQLETAILNLSRNALEAMPQGGTLHIGVTAETSDVARTLGRCVRISIEDSGIGMDEVTRTRAIEPFFSTKAVGKGIGLGLSAAHGIMLQLGGTLSISSALGEGTTVELFLPIRVPAAAAVRSCAIPPHRLRPISTVLLVDDNDSVRAGTADMLVDLGFVVRETSSAEEAMNLIRHGEHLDILITDQMMPGMGGADLAYAVRQQRPQTPVLIISGFAEVQSMACDLPRLTKPFAQAELAHCIASLLS
jgi:CheY-like chemotaxis protein